MSDPVHGFRRHRTLLLATLAGAAILGGAWWWGMEEMRAGVKTYLDTVVIPGTAKTGFVFSYDAVERQGLASVVIKAPRFVGKEEEGLARLTAPQIELRPGGWKRIGLRMPEGMRLEDAHSVVALYGDTPLHFTLGWNDLEKAPDQGTFHLPKILTLRIGTTEGKSRAEFQMTQRSGEISVRHSDGGKVRGKVELKDVALQEMVKSASIMRAKGIELGYRVAQNPGGYYDWSQTLELTAIRPDAAALTRKSNKDLDQAFDLGWDAMGRLVPVPPRESHELPKTVDGPVPMLPATYMVPLGIVKNAHLGMAGIHLISAEGKWTSSLQDPLPAGRLNVTIASFTPLRVALTALNFKDPVYLRVLDTVETTLAGWGHKNADGEIVIPVTREEGQRQIQIGNVTVNEALAMMTNGLFRVMGADVAAAPAENDPQAPPSRESQEGVTPQGVPVPPTERPAMSPMPKAK